MDEVQAGTNTDLESLHPRKTLLFRQGQRDTIRRKYFSMNN